ncbi:hypothetical protein SKAU_G00321600 [Synaphobranchus kaupii]|uniref:Uncharacterized protein n=1 Tax=Synaphobranchus kaupii TaxID=118154 RepID=A0A9Q1ENX2_SYNKA|nr:hypothetical protein SKAU_G00321600 [Synaphobranchus kaupii]
MERCHGLLSPQRGKRPLALHPLRMSDMETDPGDCQPRPLHPSVIRSSVMFLCSAGEADISPALQRLGLTTSASDRSQTGAVTGAFLTVMTGCAERHVISVPDRRGMPGNDSPRMTRNHPCLAACFLSNMIEC